MGLFELLFGVALLAVLAAVALLGGREHIEKRHRKKYHEGL